MEGTLQNENKLVGTLSNGASMVGGVGTVFAKDGEDGKDGASAYEIAQKNGFEGTETEWLLSLKGERGEPGEAGANGKDGIDGKNGVDGKDGSNGQDGVNGKDGETPYIKDGNWWIGETDTGVKAQGDDGIIGKDGISATHQWNGTTLTITSASGTSSADLKGEKGEQGAPGEKGEPGEKGADGTMTFDDLTPEQKASLKGDDGQDGKDGQDGTSATHSWNGTVLTVTSASGTSSADLKGEKGDQGNPGEKGDPGEKGADGIWWDFRYDPIIIKYDSEGVRIGGDSIIIGCFIKRGSENIEGKDITWSYTTTSNVITCDIEGIEGTPGGPIWIENLPLNYPSNKDKDTITLTCVVDEITYKKTFSIVFIKDGEKGDPGEKGETGNSGVYIGSGDMPEDCYVQIDTNGETNEEIIDRYIANAVTQAIREALAQSNKITYVTLNSADWVGENSPYSQFVTIPEATAYSKIDLNPSVEQLTVFHEKDLAFVVENNGGVITVYCIGQKPLNDYTIQAKITEVSVI